jgi:hypothetical protein
MWNWMPPIAVRIPPIAVRIPPGLARVGCPALASQSGTLSRTRTGTS